MAATTKDRISPWVWVALAALLLLALAVIFVLPRLVDRYELPLVQRVEMPPVAVAPVSANSSQAPAVSPFEEAQLARQRREAQDVLAELLRRQSELDMYAVQQWAAEQFESALTAARDGDVFYREGQFAEATEAYQRGNTLLADLLDSRLQVFERLMQEGEQALADYDADTALARFRLAGELEPTSAEADQGVQRAEVLEQVADLLARGEQLQQSSDLASARELIAEAAALDPLNERAREMLRDNARRQQDAEFAATMSEGFEQLQQGNADAAIAAFERALRVRPGSEEAQAAITQTQTELTVAEIARLRAQADQQEAEEQWQQAIDTYTRALELDENLVFAQEGLDYSQRRLQLDTLLQANLDNPLRLADEAAYDEALEVFRIGSDLARDLQQEGGTVGPRLQSQLARTEALLSSMLVPVDVRLESDNATQVTLYRVGELGQFRETSLQLTPGRYVAVGTRPGYRDVREEFIVGFGYEPGTITIRCHEQIAAVNRR